MAKTDAKTYEVISTKGLNLRTGPSREYGSVQVLECGTKLTPVEIPAGVAVSGWMPVKVGRKCGWVMSKYIALVENADGAAV